MKVLILGANGKVGNKVARLLIERGHQVVAGIRSSHNNVPEGAELARLDIRDQVTLATTLQGVDVVVSALSTWRAPDDYVLSTAMKTVIPAMHAAGVSRIVSVSGDVVLLPGEKPSLGVRVVRALAFGIIRKVIDDSEKHLHLLYASDLDWTVVRPTTMTSSTDSSYHLQNEHPVSPLIPRAAVVRAIVDLVESGNHSRKAPFIVSK